MKKSRRKFYLLFLIFVIPMIISWFMYQFHDHFNFKTSNHGTLVNPAIQATDLASDASSQPKRWQIIYVPEKCDEQSDKMMFTLHQLRIALGKDHDRVNLTLATDNSCQIKDVHDFRKVTLTESQLNNLENLFQKNGLNEFVLQNKIYLVDPLGNLFMYYGIESDPMNILKDLKHVLGVSQIG